MLKEVFIGEERSTETRMKEILFHIYCCWRYKRTCLLLRIIRRVVKHLKVKPSIRHITIIPALGSLRQKYHKLQTNMFYIVRSCLKKYTNKKWNYYMTQQCQFQLYTSNIVENRTQHQQMYAYCEITDLIIGVYYQGSLKRQQNQ